MPPLGFFLVGKSRTLEVWGVGFDCGFLLAFMSYPFALELPVVALSEIGWLRQFF
jgi:hypothetical protein